MVIFAILGEKTCCSCIFHAVFCSHPFWKAVLVFRGRRIFLHSCLTFELCFSRFLPLLSKQVRPGMLSVKFLRAGVVLASVFSLLWLLCFKLQCLCLTAVLQHSGEQPRQSVCAADHSKVRSAADEVWLSSPHSHTTRKQHFYFCMPSECLQHTIYVHLSLPSFL